MTNFLKILILPIAIVTMLGSFAPRAFAVDPMTVIFENNPLFGEVNFLPGDSKDGDATVTNNTATAQNVYAESVNGFDPDGLGSQLYLKVFENGNIVPVYQNEFDDFLSAGPVPLSALGGGATKTYTFVVSFIDSADNDYMGKSLGFDLCIGFSGGAFQCGDTVISGEEDTVGNGDGGGTIDGSGGSSSGGTTQLLIFNERVINIDPIDGTVVITWNTNLLATSQVVYGPTPPSYALDLNAVFFGYPSGSIETTTKVVNHSVTLTGLVPGGTYIYRVVSRASPPTISSEHKFSLPQSLPSGAVLASVTGPIGGSATANNLGEGGVVFGDATTSDNINAVSQMAAVVLTNFNLSCLAVALLIFIILLALVWFIFKNREDKTLKKELLSLVIFTVVASIILWLIPYTCPLVPLWIMVALYVIWKTLMLKINAKNRE